MGSDSKNDSSDKDKVKTKRSKEQDSPRSYKKPRYNLDEDHDSEKSSKRKRYRRSRSRSRSRSKERAKKGSRRYDEYGDKRYPRYYGDDERVEEDDDNVVVGERYYKYEKEQNDKKAIKTEKTEVQPRQRKQVDLITSKTGGAYIPPAKLRMMQAEITDKTSAAYQRIAWEALKKSVHGYINKVNTSNIGIIARELLHENIVRGRGLLCKSIIQAQAASPTFTHVYSALVSVINSKFPNIGELLLKRLVLQFKRGFKQNNKAICITATSFIAHLVNQQVAHEILALEILTLLVESPTDDSVEVAISFLKECGQKLTEVSSKGINAIFEMLRNILHEGQLEKRIQYMIEVMFQIRKDGFKDHAAVIEELDLVGEEDQFTHLITLDDVEAKNGEDFLNVFKFDENYEENEGKYKTISKEILDSDGSGSESGSEGSEDSDGEEEEEEEEEVKDNNLIIDNTETNLVALRRTIYLTVQSSLDFEECAHKLMKMELKPGQEIELCHMFLDCCAEQRTYEKFYGLLSQRFCQINKIYVTPFEKIFKDTYATTHRLDTNRLRNVSKFFAHLLFTDAIGWEVFEIMKLNEQDTNSSSRIFIKILFQELSEHMGLAKLNARLKDPTLQKSFEGLFPRDNPENTRFAINFFTSIGLGGLTDELRTHLKSLPKTNPTAEFSSPSSESSSSSNGSSSSSDSSSSEDSSSDEKRKKNKKKTNLKTQSKHKSKNKKNNSDSSDSDEEEEKQPDKTRRKPVGNFRDDRRRDQKGDERSNAKDRYEWSKSRYEDNITQLRKEREIYELSNRTKNWRNNKNDRPYGNENRSRYRPRNDREDRDRNRDRKRDEPSSVRHS